MVRSGSTRAATHIYLVCESPSQGPVSMSTAEFGSLCFVLAVLLGSAHLLGHFFTRLHQPKVIGEILAGLILGPTVLGRFAPHWNLTSALNGSNHASAATLG